MSVNTFTLSFKRLKIRNESFYSASQISLGVTLDLIECIIKWESSFNNIRKLTDPKPLNEIIKNEIIIKQINRWHSKQII